jgi:hypothetical protein
MSGRGLREIIVVIEAKARAKTSGLAARAWGIAS